MSNNMRIKIEGGPQIMFMKATDADTGRVLPFSKLKLEVGVGNNEREMMADIRIVVNEVELEAIVRELAIEVLPAEVHKEEEGKFREYIYYYPLMKKEGE